MPTQTEVVYPSTSSFSGAAQLNEGPFFVPSVKRLLRLELHGLENFQGVLIGNTSVGANFQLYAVQWVPHGSPAADCITTADGPNWLIRRQIGTQDQSVFWSNATFDAYELYSLAFDDCWAGQLAINADIDLYLLLRAPTGVSISNMNLFASMRFWWS